MSVAVSIHLVVRDGSSFGSPAIFGSSVGGCGRAAGATTASTDGPRAGSTSVSIGLSIGSSASVITATASGTGTTAKPPDAPAPPAPGSSIRAAAAAVALRVAVIVIHFDWGSGIGADAEAAGGAGVVASAWADCVSAIGSAADAAWVSDAAATSTASETPRRTSFDRSALRARLRRPSVAETDSPSRAAHSAVERPERYFSTSGSRQPEGSAASSSSSTASLDWRAMRSKSTASVAVGRSASKRRSRASRRLRVRLSFEATRTVTVCSQPPTLASAGSARPRRISSARAICTASSASAGAATARRAAARIAGAWRRTSSVSDSSSAEAYHARSRWPSDGAEGASRRNEGISARAAGAGFTLPSPPGARLGAAFPVIWAEAASSHPIAMGWLPRGPYRTPIRHRVAIVDGSSHEGQTRPASTP